MTKEQNPPPELPKCPWCGKPFIPRTAWQKYDKPACQVAAWHEANPRVKVKVKPDDRLL